MSLTGFLVWITKVTLKWAGNTELFYLKRGRDTFQVLGKRSLVSLF